MVYENESEEGPEIFSPALIWHNTVCAIPQKQDLLEYIVGFPFIIYNLWYTVLVSPQVSPLNLLKS